jgi:hypothetical protein
MAGLTDLETLRDRVESLLTDSSNLEWTTTELDQAIRLALYELSTVLPVRASTTIDAVASTWEYSLSSITGLVAVVEVWYPYLSTSDTYKQPHPCKWRMITDFTLLLECEDGPDATYDLRVFYDKVQTLKDLDSASSTTVDDAEKAALVLGAAGYAAIGKARDVVNEVTIGAEVPLTLEKWGTARLTEFQERIVALAAVANAGDDSRIGWWEVDKWDKTGQD